MGNTIKRELRQAIEPLLPEGYRIEYAGRARHPRVVSPQGGKYYLSGSAVSGRSRAVENCKAGIRRWVREQEGGGPV